MVSRNSVLLIVKNKPGIRYTEILSNILGDYSSINSARAALSRSMRYLEALGLIKRKGNAVFITSKGLAMLYKEMKSKLILKLNDAVKAKNASETVKQLSVLVERSKIETDLLETAKKNIGFYICDLESIESDLEKQIKQLSYLSSVLTKQIEALKEMNFRNKLMLDKERFANVCKTILEKEKPQELVVTAQPEVLASLAEFLEEQVQKNALIIPNSKATRLVNFLSEKPARVTVAFQDVVIKLGENCEIIAPAKKLEFLG